MGPAAAETSDVVPFENLYGAVVLDADWPPTSAPEPEVVTLTVMVWKAVSVTVNSVPQAAISPTEESSLKVDVVVGVDDFTPVPVPVGA